MLQETINTLYGKNLACSALVNDVDTVSRVYKIETRLSEWQQQLPPEMKLVNAKDIFAEGLTPADDATEDEWRQLRLRFVLTVRYINVRILLHRPILVKFMEDLRHPNNSPDLPILLQIGTTNIQIAAKSGMELLYLVRNALRYSPGRSKWGLLGAWWYSLYYSKALAATQMSLIMLTVSSI